MNTHRRHLLCLGLGYTARALAAHLDHESWRISGSARTATGVGAIMEAGHTGFLFDGRHRSDELVAELETATHLLISTPPGPDDDPVIELHGADIAASPHLEWVGYLSSIAVYGDQQGGWVDERTEPQPIDERGRCRLASENRWQALCTAAAKRLQIFRLAGIYGPGRSAIEAMRNGTARRIVKPGQVFNRIHVDDIAIALLAGIADSGGSTVFNLADDEPAPPQDVVSFAAEVLGLAPPPETPFEAALLSPVARTFYVECKRVRNAYVKETLRLELRYPTYREGLRAIAFGQPACNEPSEANSSASERKCSEA